jgi:protein O-mannosyl-transferase
MGRKSRSKKSRPPGSPLLDRSQKTTFQAADCPVSGSAPPVHRPFSALAVCGLLLLAVIAVFGQTRRHDFVNFDDNLYVYENRHVSGGLTGEGVLWAMTESYADNWHPLTWLSHMLDCELYGLKPGGHHLTNVFLHAMTAILLFLVLRRLTGALWPSAWAAAIFAIHPLRVESVAWVAERKDVLSGLFSMLTLWLYARYVERPPSWGRYLSVAAAYALGLTAKPMLVTLPFVLLLLDYWPLGRFGGRDRRVDGGEERWVPQSLHPPYNWHLIVEKTPLFVLAAVLCVVTLTAQRDSIRTLDEQPLSWRVANAAVAYVAYLEKMFYPDNLAVLYPLPKGPPSLWEAIAAFAVLLAISTAVFAFRRKRPYLIVGWLWYLGMLAPVIGLVQVGNQAMADRYTYLPQIGLYIAFAWGAADMAGAWPYRRWGFAAAAALIVVGLMVGAWRQTRHWHDSESLWIHTLACTSQNSLGHNNLGVLYRSRGQVEDAIVHFRKAMEIKPDYVDAHFNLAAVLAARGQIDEAIAHYRKALESDPLHAAVHLNLGSALVARGQLDEAIDQYRKALEIQPNNIAAYFNLAEALTARGQPDEAIDQYHKAIQIEPGSAEAHNNLGNALTSHGRVDEAIDHFRVAMKIKPDYAESHNNLGIALAHRGQVDEAIEHFRKALEIKPDYAEPHNNLGVAFARRGQIDEAIEHYREAVQIKPDFARAHYNLGNALTERKSFDEALGHYQMAFDLASAQNDRALADDVRDRIRKLRR